jgi:DnaK suppressor protein
MSAPKSTGVKRKGDAGPTAGASGSAKASTSAKATSAAAKAAPPRPAAGKPAKAPAAKADKTDKADKTAKAAKTGSERQATKADTPAKAASEKPARATSSRRAAGAPPATYSAAKKARADAAESVAPSVEAKARGSRPKASPDAPVGSGAKSAATAGDSASSKGVAVKETPSARHAEVSRPTRTGSGLLSARRRDVPVRRTEGYTEERFLAHQRHALEVERVTYLEQASNLRAEAEALVEEMEPGDIQFDDESGEGGTVTVDRERDLALSAQALQAVDEIDHAFVKMATMTYGICENCGRLIPKARLEALPYARLCIDCKSGGLSRR